MSEVIDLMARREAKTVLQNNAAIAKHTGEAQVLTEQVAMLGCTNCGSTQFSLGHDRRVICGKCCYAIVDLRWYDLNHDVNHPNPGA